MQPSLLQSRRTPNISQAVKDKIRDSIDVSVLLSILGFKITHRNNKELRAPCLIHGGDNPTSFRMRLDTKRFSCYSHKCEMREGRAENDIFSLVMRIKKVGFIDAVVFLSELSGVDINSGEMSLEERSKQLVRKDIARHIQMVSAMSSKHEALPELDESLVRECVENRYDYFYKRGISQEIQDFFEIGGMVDRKDIQRATIPIRDENGVLVSISGRRIDGDGEPRFLLLRDFQKRRVLYNFHNAVKTLNDWAKCLIVVEGFAATWAVVGAGFPNTAACMGTSLTEQQAALAAEHGFLNCIIMFDGDVPGKEGLEQASETAKKYMRTSVVPLYDLFPGLSPDDLDKETISNLLIDYIGLLTGETYDAEGN